MQVLQDRGQLVFGVEERSERRKPSACRKRHRSDMVEAAKSGYEYRLDERGTSWTLFKKTPQPVLFLDPRVVESAEVGEIREVFRLKRGSPSSHHPGEAQPISVHVSERGRGQHRPGDALAPAGSVLRESRDRDPPSMPPRVWVTVTRDPSGLPFDWQRLTADLFPRVLGRQRTAPPAPT